MAVPLLLCGIGVLFAMCAACFYRMGAADWADEKKFLIDSLESLASENAKLREERNHWHVEQVHAYGNWEDAYKRAIELEKQNAKLRALLIDAFVEFVRPYGNADDIHEYADRMRERGVEVDE